MKINSKNLVTLLYFLTFAFHFGYWQMFMTENVIILIKYYLFLTILFFFVLTMIKLFHKLIPEYLGFAVLGIVLMKLMLMFIIKGKLNLEEIPYFKLHFIIPYLVSLVLVTMYAIDFLKSEKK